MTREPTSALPSYNASWLRHDDAALKRQLRNPVMAHTDVRIKKKCLQRECLCPLQLLLFGVLLKDASASVDDVHTIQIKSFCHYAACVRTAIVCNITHVIFDTY